MNAQVIAPPAAPDSLLGRIRSALPRGHTLPPEIWASRHRVITLILWLHAAGILIFGLIKDFSALHVFLETSIVALTALLANPSVFGQRISSAINDRSRSVIASFGLLTTSGILVHFSGGLIEMHFHFFVMIAVVALYQEWTPFLLSILYVLFHHGVVGVIDPQAVYNHPDAWAHPWRWAGIHALFVTAMSIVCIVAWKLNESLIAHRRIAEEELLESEQRLAFLAEANAMLGSSLDYEDTLHSLTELVVPRVVDWCAIDLLDENGKLRRLAVRHSDPEKSSLAQFLNERYPPDPDSAVGAYEAIRTGASQFYPQIGQEQLEAVAVDDEHLTILQSLGFRSALVVPLRARRRSLGAITFVTADSGRSLDDDDRSMLEEVGHRAATAIDNARLYSGWNQIAQTLQRSLLPPDLPNVPGIELRARYLPAGGEGIQVGGDFYDVFQTADDEWVVVMGDVCGKGPDAAALTGLVRSTLRGIAVQVRNPVTAVTSLNAVLLEKELGERFCTLTYLRLRVSEGQASITLTSAGHPLPTLVSKEGKVRQVGEPGSILGQFEELTLVEAKANLAPGDRLVLVTDGVMDARSGDGVSLDNLLEELLRDAALLDVDALAQRIQDRALEIQEGTPHDDIAVLVIAPKPSTASARKHHVNGKPADVSLSVPANLEAPSSVRRAIRQRLSSLDDEVRNDLELVISEIIANRIKHSGLTGSDSIDVDIRVDGDRIHAEVRDPGDSFQAEEPALPERSAESGRGLWVVDQLAADWGVSSTPTRVWFELLRASDSIAGQPTTIKPKLVS